MADYRFVTFWHLEAPLQMVFDAVSDSLRWPAWWHGAKEVTELEPGNSLGIGSVRRYCWKSRLPHHLCFDARTIHIEPMQTLEAAVAGDLEGHGRWTFSHQDGITAVRYEWQVRTTRCWMNLAAPLARPLFEANHHALMRQGAEGLARHLDARLLLVSQREMPDAAARSDAIAPFAAAAAGTIAGMVATAVQIASWWSASYPLPQMLWRDTRLAAAILLGPAILPPPMTFDWRALGAATLIHLALSIVYGLILAPLLSRLKHVPARAMGAAFGLLLYAINMYGFTLLFPWFDASRNWITVIAHLAFGIAAATVYRKLSRRY